MTFVQIIEFRTSDIDSAQEINEEWRQATEGKRTLRRELVARDHSDPDRYFAIEFFDSYDSAMENSELPETKTAAERYQQVADGPAVFYNMDVLATNP